MTEVVLGDFHFLNNLCSVVEGEEQKNYLVDHRDIEQELLLISERHEPC